MRTFFRELEKILARMNDAQKARAAGVLRGLLHGLANFKDAIPGLPFKATSMLIGDLMMYMSMHKKGPDVWQKAKKIADETGPNSAALMSFLSDADAAIAS